MLVHVLHPIYLSPPTEDKWRSIASSFLQDWNIPNCIGAFDGKQVQIQAPPNSGTTHFCYKGIFSLVLLAACDANYKFTLVDFGEAGSNNDAGIFENSHISYAIQRDELNIPRGHALLPGTLIGTQCYFVGDEAFGLSTRMMRPYPGTCLPENKRIFNYRLSRARRVIENAFGILALRWRVLRKPIALCTRKTDKIVMACLCLHNFLKTLDELKEPNNRMYCPPNFVDRENPDGTWRRGLWREDEGVNSGLIDDALYDINMIEPIDAEQMRNILSMYFLTNAGMVPWQWDHIYNAGPILMNN